MAEKRSLVELVTGARQDKQQWRAYVRRRDALAEPYKLVMCDIENYMYMMGLDESVMDVFGAIVDLFEEGAASGRLVLDVTGDDVADFAYSVLQAVQAKTWTGEQAKKLNARVRQHLAGVKEAQL